MGLQNERMRTGREIRLIIRCINCFHCMLLNYFAQLLVTAKVHRGGGGDAFNFFPRCVLWDFEAVAGTVSGSRDVSLFDRKWRKLTREARLRSPGRKRPRAELNVGFSL